jgi:hypothetical protein
MTLVAPASSLISVREWQGRTATRISHQFGTNRPFRQYYQIGKRALSPGIGPITVALSHTGGH